MQWRHEGKTVDETEHQFNKTQLKKSNLYMMLHNTTAVDIIMLGFMTFGVWHERDSDKAGGGGGRGRKFW